MNSKQAVDQGLMKQPKSAPRRLKLVKGTDLKPWQHPAQTGLIDFMRYLPDDRIEKARNDVLMDFQRTVWGRQAYYNRWIPWYQLYRCFSPYYNSQPEHMSRSFIPMTFELIETSVAREMSASWDTSPFWNCIAAASDMQNSAFLTEQRLQNIVRNSNFYEEHYYVVKSKKMYGTAWWKYEYENGLNYTGPRAFHCDILDTYPDLLTPEVKNMRFIIHRYIAHRDDVENMRDQGLVKNVDEGLKKDTGKNIAWSNIDRLRTVGQTGPKAAQAMEKLGQFHEIIEYWGRCRDERTNEVFNVVHTVMDREFTIRFEESPFYLKDEKEGFHYAIKPFTRMVEVPMAREVYGIGITEIVEQLQYEINDTHNMMMDSKKLTLAPVFEMDMGRLDEDRMPWENLTWEPGKIIPVNDLGNNSPAIRPVTVPTQWTMGYQDIENLIERARQGVGLMAAMEGIEGHIRETATQFSLRLKEAYERSKNNIRFAEQALGEVGRTLYLLDRQFTKEDVMLTLYDKQRAIEWININPSKIKFEGDFQISVANLYGIKELQAQKATEFLKALTVIPSWELLVNPSVVIRYIAENMGLPTDTLFPDPATMAKQMPPAAPGQPQLAAGGGNMPQNPAAAVQAAAAAPAQQQDQYQQLIRSQAQKNKVALTT